MSMIPSLRSKKKVDQTIVKLWKHRAFMKFFILLASLITYTAYAYEVDEVSSGDTLESIATRNLDRVWMKYTNSAEYSKDIIKWNPQIQDWNNLKKNQVIYVDYPYTHFMTGSTWTPNLDL